MCVGQIAFSSCRGREGHELYLCDRSNLSWRWKSDLLLFYVGDTVFFPVVVVNSLKNSFNTHTRRQTDWVLKCCILCSSRSNFREKKGTQMDDTYFKCASFFGLVSLRNDVVVGYRYRIEFKSCLLYTSRCV